MHVSHADQVQHAGVRTSLAAVVGAEEVGAEEFEAAEEQVPPAEGVELPHHATHHAVADGRGVSAQLTCGHAWGLCRLGACGPKASIVVITSWTSAAGELR